MPLSEEQISSFHSAIKDYSFPAVFYDFDRNKEVEALSMGVVENVVNAQLRSARTEDVKHGLANILYWGYANIGYRDVRVENLKSNVVVEQIRAFQALVANSRVPTMEEIKAIRIPQYSGVSFLSKVLMFLDPIEYCVLDKQITRLRTANSAKALNGLSFGPKEEQIRVSHRNEVVYHRWRHECLGISATYFENNYRAVDIERGFFHLIQKQRLTEAQAIYNSA